MSGVHVHTLGLAGLALMNASREYSGSVTSKHHHQPAKKERKSKAQRAARKRNRK